MFKIKDMILENKKHHNKLTSSHESPFSYELNLDLRDFKYIGIYSRDKFITKCFLKVLAGINKSKSGRSEYQEFDVFDNKEYFQKRLYFDYETNYVSTLNPDKLSDTFMQKFKKEFDSTKFKKIVKDLNIRGECTITSKYEFTNIGNTLVNHALSISLPYKILIINNPTLYIKNNHQIKYISDNFKNDYETVVLGLNDLGLITKELEIIIVFDDFGFVHSLNPNDELVVLNAQQNLDEYKANKLFISNDGKRLILHGFNKDDFKKLKKAKIDYIIISLNEVGGYLWKKSSR